MLTMMYRTNALIQQLLYFPELEPQLHHQKATEPSDNATIKHKIHKPKPRAFPSQISFKSRSSNYTQTHEGIEWREASVRRGRKESPFLASGVPDLSLDALVLDDKRPGLELDADGGLGVQAELVPREAREYLGLADGGVPDQDHLEDVVDLLAGIPVASPARHWRRRRRPTLGLAFFSLSTSHSLSLSISCHCQDLRGWREREGDRDERAYGEAKGARAAFWWEVEDD